ncbi:MAG: carbonic anhydrase [Pirellulaceae bacterium]|nr:carbonic anhydrase [Pirellulaceae bacterium]MDG1809911.1 carbonic anhydrase [Pirellulaceae bacterium]MDG2105174.1 carbonic anhydrase [Pirellulaceae bacterium]
MKSRVSLRPDLHEFPKNGFGSLVGLVKPPASRIRDTLIIACSELGAAPDCLSFGDADRFLVLQHLAASMPSYQECENDERLSLEEVARLFDQHQFQHLIVCGHLGCGVIPYWLRPIKSGADDTNGFRRRFENGTLRLVDNHYTPKSLSERRELLIFEHVLCQIENLLTHPFLEQRVRSGNTSMYGWVVDDESARIYGYRAEESAFVLI